MMRRTVLAILVTALLLPAAAPAGSGGALRQLQLQVEVKTEVLNARLGELDGVRADLEEAWARVVRLSADLARAYRQGETLDSLALREADLRTAEAELEASLGRARDLRQSVLELERELEILGARIEALRSGERGGHDPLSGRWRVTVEPGGLEGEIEFDLEGTLVTGVYTLSGGWYGSLKGTLVGDKVRLERIDSQLGFASILYGQVFADEDPPRIQGTWEATNLSAGLPSSGTWVAVKVREHEGGTE